MVMSDGKRKLSDWYVPPDIAFTCGLYFVVIPIAILSAILFPLLYDAKRAGDRTLLYAALAVGMAGILLLFFARLPLYRQRRFFTFGSRALDDRHRRLYRWAYRLIVACALLLVALILALR